MDLIKMRDRLRHDRPVPWEQMPDFPLYMDQVLNYMDRQVIRFDRDETLTAAMVNNYTKSGLVPRAEGKKYNREHLAYLTAICILKRVMSTRDMDMLIRDELREAHTVEDGYAAFCDSLDKALNITADEMDTRSENDSLADAAIHFALLSYAAGIASSRYVSLLRQEKEAGRRGRRSAKPGHAPIMESEPAPGQLKKKKAAPESGGQNHAPQLPAPSQPNETESAGHTEQGETKA